MRAACHDARPKGFVEIFFKKKKKRKEEGVKEEEGIIKRKMYVHVDEHLLHARYLPSALCLLPAFLLIWPRGLLPVFLHGVLLRLRVQSPTLLAAWLALAGPQALQPFPTAAYG